jgi:hypothetical protein
MPSKHEVRISYSTITEESASEGDHAENGWMHPDEYRSEESVQWGLRDAMRFMGEKCLHIETDWTPEIGTGRGFGSRWFGGTGCTDDCEGDELEVCYDLHIKHVSDGTAMRLARLMASNGVYFANVRTLQRRKPRVTHWSYGSGSAGCLYDHGPCFAETKEQAIDGALFIFDDLPEAELKTARANLDASGLHYFTDPHEAGAQIVEINEHSGPCPDNDQ